MQPGAMLAALSLTVTAFWCACARKGTLTAALCVLPVLCAFLVAVACGVVTATALDPIAFFRLHPAAIQSPYVFLFPLAPVLIFALIQSYRMFRTPPEDTVISTIRLLLPVMVIAFWGSFVRAAFGLHG